MACDPLVSVGIPTYNRVGMLQRAVESVLTQDYPSVEVVISDNASTDGTRAWCEDLCRRDNRIRYVHQQANIGLVANYAEVLKHSHGALYMAFADDDWLDTSYISQCVRTLLEQPDLVLVCGKWRMFREQEFLREGVKIDLSQGSGRDRVLAFYKHINEDEIFHGVARRDLLTSLPPLLNVVGGDWIYMASVAFAGKVTTIETVAVNKSIGGTSADVGKIARVQRMSRLRARLWYLYLPMYACRDILWISPVYKSSGYWARFSLAFRVAILLLWRFAGQSGRSVPWPLSRLLNRTSVS